MLQKHYEKIFPQLSQYMRHFSSVTTQYTTLHVLSAVSLLNFKLSNFLKFVAIIQKISYDKHHEMICNELFKRRKKFCHDKEA